MIYDSHVHPDNKKYPSTVDAANYLYTNFKNRVSGMILIGLHELQCTNEDLAKVGEHKDMGRYFKLAGSLEKLDRDYVKETFEKYFATGKFSVLKIHPRIQGFSMSDERILWALGEFEKYNMPILVDVFHDGRQLLREDPLKNIAAVAEKFPKLRIIAAHSGGYEIFRALTFAKTFKNIYLDLSFSFLYFRESSLKQDFFYAIKSLKGDRILFGTDYPDRAYDTSIDMSLELLNSSDLNQEMKDKFLAKNTMGLLGIA